MIAFFLLIALVCGFSQVLSAPLDDYVWKADSNYGWVEMPEHNIVGEKLGFTVCSFKFYDLKINQLILKCIYVFPFLELGLHVKYDIATVAYGSRFFTILPS